MLILRRFSKSDLLKGVSYIDAQVGRVNDSTALIGRPTKRVRNRIQKFTKPTIKILKEE